MGWDRRPPEVPVDNVSNTGLLERLLRRTVFDHCHPRHTESGGELDEVEAAV